MIQIKISSDCLQAAFILLNFDLCDLRLQVLLGVKTCGVSSFDKSIGKQGYHIQFIDNFDPFDIFTFVLEVLIEINEAMRRCVYKLCLSFLFHFL